MSLPSRYKFARKSDLQLLFIAFFLTLLLAGCATYKIPTESFVSLPCQMPLDDNQNTRETQALAHPLYKIIPRHRSQIQWFDIGHWVTWMLFGNDDDGIFGEGPRALYKPNKPITCLKACQWSCRNPLHNFCFYVIGIADVTNSEFSLIKIEKNKGCIFSYRKQAEGNNGKGSFFFLGFHGWKPYIFLRLLYSQKYKGQWYLGWRERGNFGIMFLPFTTLKPDDVQ